MRRNQIDFLFKKADELFLNIEDKYKTAVEGRNIDDNSLKIEILFYLVCFRVVLDYLAQDIRDFCEIKINKRGIYFPILGNIEEFNSSKQIFVSEIKKQNFSIYSYLLNIQPFSEYGDSRKWLGDFNTLVNKNKHDSLTPNVVVEQLGISILGRKVRSITVGAGGRLVDSNGNNLVSTFKRIDHESVDDLRNQGVVSEGFRKEKWDSINFEDIEEPVPDFLKKVKNNVSSIVVDIYNLLE